MSPQQITLSTWQHARGALRNRYLRQGLYDEGTALMSGVIVNLHDAEHTARRRLENRLFRRDTFAFWEQDLIPHNIAESISTHLAAGSVDLLRRQKRDCDEIHPAAGGGSDCPPAARRVTGHHPRGLLHARSPISSVE